MASGCWAVDARPLTAALACCGPALASGTEPTVRGLCACMCACVHVRARCARAVCVHACACAPACPLYKGCVRVRAHVCACVRMDVHAHEVVGKTALVMLRSSPSRRSGTPSRTCTSGSSARRCGFPGQSWQSQCLHGGGARSTEGIICRPNMCALKQCARLTMMWVHPEMMRVPREDVRPETVCSAACSSWLRASAHVKDACFTQALASHRLHTGACFTQALASHRRLLHTGVSFASTQLGIPYKGQLRA